jgi:hypothetical protein
MTRILDNKNVKAMILALKNSGLTPKEDRSTGTVSLDVKNRQTGKTVRVFGALQKSNNVWIVTHHDQLFQS